MTGLNLYKTNDLSYSHGDWFQFLTILGGLSKNLRQEKPIVEVELIDAISFIFSVAQSFNIDLENEWKKWNKKASTKRYHRPKHMLYSST